MFTGIPIWKEAPVCRLVIPFIVGILIQHYTQNPATAGYLLFALSAIPVAVFGILKLADRFSFYHIQGICIQLAFVAAGCIICQLKNPYLPRESITKYMKEEMAIVVSFEEPFLEKKSSWKALARMEKIIGKDSTIYPASNIIVYIRKEKTTILPKYGQRIIFGKELVSIRNYAALNGFDYQQYCALKNIHFQVFLRAGEYRLLPGDRSTFIARFIFRIQQWTVNTLKNNIPDKNACGMAMALLIGYKNELDPHILSSYSNTGVVHVIAISGLHLGIIYSILSYCCRPFLRMRRFRWINPLIILSGLWTFSLLAGASPSVVRSAVMFTFIVAGQLIQKKGSLYNNLSASALCLLAYNPYWLFDLGFQLSYAALLGIAAYARPLYYLYLGSNKVIDYIWQLNAVTISAQLLTAPILVYQFHQFPLFFLLTNFIAIPVSTGILLSEIALCAAAPWPLLSNALGGLISWLINTLNRCVQYIEKLPYSSVTQIHINLYQTLLAYLFIICVSCWLMLVERKFVAYSLCCAIMLFAPAWVKIWR